MPVDVGETINYFADAFLKAPLVNSIARNPIYTALLVTFIIVLIVMFIFRDAETDESLLIICLRAGFWVFFMMLGVLFLHNKVLIEDTNGATRNSAYENVFNGGYSGVTLPGDSIPASLEDSIVPVHINTNFTN
jgi:hypothetical protein